MGIIDTKVETRTLKCDGPGCAKSVTFDKTQAEATNNNPENGWLKPGRVVNTNDARTLFYCSDACEVGGITSGNHSPKEQPKIHTEANPAAVAQAVQAAANARNNEQALREGSAKIQIAPR